MPLTVLPPIPADPALPLPRQPPPPAAMLPPPAAAAAGRAEVADRCHPLSEVYPWQQQLVLPVLLLVMGRSASLPHAWAAPTLPGGRIPPYDLQQACGKAAQ